MVGKRTAEKSRGLISRERNVVGSLRSLARLFAFAGLCGPLALAPPSESAAAELYVAGDVGGSWVSGSNRGSVQSEGVDVSGADSASSVVGGLALGLAFPIEDVWTPFEELPAWIERGTLRADLDVQLGRDYSAQLTATNMVGDALDLDIDVSTLSFMANGWLDVPIYERLYGYLGVGVGVSSTDLILSVPALDSRIRTDDTSFSYQVSTGVGVRLGERWHFSAGYRFVGIGQSSLDFKGDADRPASTASTSLRAHELVTTLRFDLETF